MTATNSYATARAGAPGEIAPAHPNRVSTGVHGLDELIEGGLPRGRVVKLEGPGGAGKTTLGIQFLMHGITARDEHGVYIGFAHEIDDLRHDMLRFGWDLEAAEKEGKLVVVPVQPIIDRSSTMDLTKLLDEIRAAVTNVNAQRIVFDCLLLNVDGHNHEDVFRLCSLFRELSCSSIVTWATNHEGDADSDIAPLVTQGSIVIHISHTYRAIEIHSMRGTRHDNNVHRMRFTDHGIVVAPGEHPF